MISSSHGPPNSSARTKTPFPTARPESVPTEVLDRLARLAANALGSPVALVAVLAEAESSRRSAFGMPDAVWAREGVLLADGLCRRIIESGAPLVIQDATLHAATRSIERVPGLSIGACLGVPLFTATGEAVGALCVIHDSARSWTERDIAVLTDLGAVATSEITCRDDTAHYRALYRGNPFPMWIFDKETHRFVSVNDAALEHYGYSREEFLGMTILDIRTLEDAVALRAEVKGGIATGRQEQIRRHQRKDGSVFDVEIITHDIVYGGRPARFVLARDVSLHRRAEDRYRQLVETAHEGIWTVDAVGITTYVNARLCEMLGYSSAELLGRQVFDFLAPDSAFEARNLFARRMRGIAEVQEMMLYRRDATAFMALASMSPLTEDGQFAGALLLLTDITERRRIEDALRESQELLAAAEELAHTGSWAVDVATGEVVWSEQLYRIMGLPDGMRRITREAFLAQVHPEDHARLGAEFARLVKTGDAEAVQIRITRPDGDVRIIQARGRVHRSAFGRVTRVLGSVQDVTDRVAAVAEIERAHGQLATVVNDAPLGIATVDTQGRVTSWNPGAERLFGWRADEVIGQPLPTIPAELEDEFHRILDEQMNKGGIHGLETQRLRKDGTLVDVEVATAPVRDRSGAIVGGMGFFFDVTHRKQLEGQLRQAQKIEAIGQLAGGIAHDFNNIITAIKLHSEFLLESLAADDSRRDDVEEVRKAAARAAGLTRQLLAFSRKQLLKPIVLDLNETVRELQKMVIRLIGEDIMIDAELEPGLANVVADAGQIEQVLINLAVNARDAMPRGGRISIRTANVDLDGEYTEAHPVLAKGRYVMLAVGDTGSGMTDEVQSRLFEPFFTTKGLRGGTGLGLSTVYGIVQQSNGFITVRSTPGHGSLFTIYLPAAERVDAIPVNHSNSASVARGSEVVLLVEDEEGVRALARRILTRQGYVVLEATDGRHALNVTARYEGRIDIVVTDAVMPEMGGLDLIRAVRALRPDIRVLLMSGYTDDEMTRRGILTPELAFLPKPFDVDDLLRLVREVLEGEPAALRD